MTWFRTSAINILCCSLLLLGLQSVHSFSASWAGQTKLSEQQIRELALRKLSQVQSLKLDVQGDSITISGMVSSFFEKRNIAKGLLSIHGVNRLVNNITVAPEARIDTQIKNNINAGLAGQAWFLPRLRHSVAVRVEKNIVTLNGHVQTLREKNLIEELVASIRGIKDVVNNISVEQSHPVRQNDQIKKEVELSLISELGEDGAKPVLVEVQDNKVTLKGRVRNYWEKMGAYQAAESVPGVKDITNLLEVD